MIAASTSASPPKVDELVQDESSSIIRTTTRALLAPRRFVPILLMAIPLLAAQGTYSKDPLAIPLGIAMCLLFVLVAPISYRVLFPEGLEFSHGAVRLALYATIGAGVVLTVGAVIPKVLDMDATLMTARPSLVICAALFLVGGWGLARDIRFERSLLQAEARALVLEREAERSQLLALRSHLDPHFLFNTLNAIAEWCREDGETAERAVLQLSAMLRGVLSGVKRETWPLERELELVRTLFSLHLLRDPTLFQLVERVDPELHAVPVPPMILLPLAENAVKHGPAAGHRGEIRLELVREETTLRITMQNPGSYQGPRVGSDGIPTLQRRLDLAYDGRAKLTLGPAHEADSSAAPSHAATRAVMELPLAGPVTGA